MALFWKVTTHMAFHIIMWIPLGISHHFLSLTWALSFNTGYKYCVLWCVSVSPFSLSNPHLQHQSLKILPFHPKPIRKHVFMGACVYVYVWFTRHIQLAAVAAAADPCSRSSSSRSSIVEAGNICQPASLELIFRNLNI